MFSTRRLLALLVCVVTLLGAFSLSAFAAEDDSGILTFAEVQLPTGDMDLSALVESGPESWGIFDIPNGFVWNGVTYYQINWANNILQYIADSNVSNVYNGSSGWVYPDAKVVKFQGGILDSPDASAADAFLKCLRPVRVHPEDLLPVFDNLTKQLNVTVVVTVLAAVVTVSAGLAFMWWGVRKVSGALLVAFKKGKIRL